MSESASSPLARKAWTGRSLFEFFEHEAERGRGWPRLSERGKLRWSNLAARIEREIAVAGPADEGQTAPEIDESGLCWRKDCDCGKRHKGDDPDAALTALAGRGPEITDTTVEKAAKAIWEEGRTGQFGVPLWDQSKREDAKADTRRMARAALDAVVEEKA